VLAWIDCELEAVHPGGDHDIVVGRVRDLEVAHEGAPLVFFRGGYAQLAG
jgi:flavin reductase (DIM6/NTAB) family NADH-FMN oxidoreductase RutF